jgi:hypothetical protein
MGMQSLFGQSIDEFQRNYTWVLLFVLHNMIIDMRSNHHFIDFQSLNYVIIARDYFINHRV